MDDQQAIERYRYMLRTAPPDDVERAHEEAFERLTPEQRAQVLRELSQAVPPSEVPSGDDPGSLARMATRAEMRDPGTLERTFGRMHGPGLGGMFLSTMAGAFLGTAIYGALFDGQEDGAGSETGTDPGGETDAGDFAEADVDGGDFGGGDFGGGDFGGI